MDATEFLTHYRVSILEDREAIAVLAYVLRNGPQTNEELKKALKLQDQALQRTLAKLFRGHFIVRSGTDKWTITNLSEQALDQMRITQLATTDLAKRVTHNAELLIIIDACSSSGNQAARRTLLTHLRTWQLAFQQAEQDLATRDRSLLFYSFLSCPREARWSPKRLEPLLGVNRLATSESTARESSTRARDLNIPTCQAAMSRADDLLEESNTLLHFAGHGNWQPPNEDTLELTWIRALDACLTGIVDPGLHYTCLDWGVEEASDLWHNLLRHERLASGTRRLYERWTGLNMPQEESILKDLAIRLLQSLNKADNEEVTDAYFPPISSNWTYDEMAIQIERISEKLSQVDPLLFPNAAKTVLLSASDHLRSTLAALTGTEE